MAEYDPQIAAARALHHGREAESIQAPKPVLPVARCGDCLYAGLFGTLPQYQCRRESPIVGGGGWYVVFDADWCGEFVHKTLGAQLSDGAYGKRWRFPTEPE